MKTDRSGDPRAVIRADASPAIGGGHIARCLVLARRLEARGLAVSFWCNADARAMFPALDRFHVVEVPPGGGMMAGMDRLSRCSVDWLIVDHYDWTATEDRACRQWAPRILAIDDTASRARDVDVLLNQNPGFSSGDYDGLVSQTASLLIGPDYALLRDEFAAAAYIPTDRVREEVRILVCLGAGDQEATLDRLLPILARLAGTHAVTVVTRDPHGRAGEYGKNWRFVSCIDDMAAELSGSDVVVGGGGVSLLERCAVGRPSITAIVADNQVRPTRVAEAAGATMAVDFRATDAGPRFEVALTHLLDDADLRRTMAARASALCDGGGVDRVCRSLHFDKRLEETSG